MKLIAALKIFNTTAFAKKIFVFNLVNRLDEFVGRMSAQGEYKPSLNIPFLPGKMLSTLRLIEELKQKSRLLNRALYGPCQLTLSRPGFKKNISHFSTKSALLAIQIALYFFFIFVILLAHLKKRLAFLLVLKFYQIYILLLCWF